VTVTLNVFKWLATGQSSGKLLLLTLHIHCRLFALLNEMLTIILHCNINIVLIVLL